MLYYLLFVIYYVLPLSYGLYCFTTVWDCVRQVCQDLQESCCTNHSILEDVDGLNITEFEINPTNNSYQCTFCNAIQVSDQWSDWSECSATCGESGQRLRTKLCPVYGHYSERCSGLFQEIQPCLDLPECEEPLGDTPLCEILLIIVGILLILVTVILIGFCIYVKWKENLKAKQALLSHILSTTRKSEGEMSSCSVIFQKGHQDPDQVQGLNDVTDDPLALIPLPSPTGEVQRRIIPSILFRQDSEMSNDTNLDVILRNQAPGYVSFK